MVLCMVADGIGHFTEQLAYGELLKLFLRKLLLV